MQFLSKAGSRTSLQDKVGIEILAGTPPPPLQIRTILYLSSPYQIIRINGFFLLIVNILIEEN